MKKKREVVKGGSVKPQRRKSKKMVKKNFFARTWERFVLWLKN